MGKEIDLLKNYPKSKRNIDDRKNNKSEKNREIARRFDKSFFDGDRETGYGGFKYDEKFWTNVIPTFIDYWKINENSSILDVGCAKGFMIYDFLRIMPKIKIRGIDLSTYAIENAIIPTKSLVSVANAKNLPFKDNEFDYVISINTIHNLEKSECGLALQEIQRVSKKKSFITVDAYNSEQEKERMYAWNLTAKTIMSVDEWKLFFDLNGYEGDYFWFIP